MRILVAGIGNIFFGDDAFGVEVARELMRRESGPEVRVEDFGIRSYDLAYAMMDGCDATILVDATQRGEAPGTLYLVEPDPNAAGCERADPHSMDPVAVLQMARSLGGEPRGKMYVVGCEPANLEPDECQSGLSEVVEAAVPQAVEMVEALVRDLLAGNPIPTKEG